MPKSLEELEEENETATVEAELIAKRARIAELKRLYGSDWKRVAKGMLGGFKNLVGEPPSVMKK